MPATTPNVTCPFCGLGCDDLTVRTDQHRLVLDTPPCARAAAGFAAGDNAGPDALIDGQPATRDDAVARAAALLTDARQPLFSGMGTDVGGARAVLALADRLGAVVDHMNADDALRETLAFQAGGASLTTLTEARNRADLFLVVGTDVIPGWPRFIERVVWPAEAMHLDTLGERQIVLLGDGLDPEPLTSPDGRLPEHVRCNPRALGHLVGALRARLAGRDLTTASVGGLTVHQVDALLSRLRAARYGVAVWSAATWGPAHGELGAQALNALLQDLNDEGRWAGLPLGGHDGDHSFSQVAAWQTGYPVRMGFGAGFPNYDPYHHATSRMAGGGEADCVVWISAFDGGHAPPPGVAPDVILARPPLETRWRDAPVVLPVGAPGVHHAGWTFRSDGVALRLGAVTGGPPSVAETIEALDRAATAGVRP